MKKSVFYAFLIVIGLRVAVLMAMHQWSLSLGREGFSPLAVGGGDDGQYYYDAAITIAEGGAAFVSNGYPVLLGTLIRLTGITDVFWYKVLNCAVGCASLIVAYFLLRRMVGGKTHTAMVRISSRPQLALILLMGFYPGAIWIVSGSLYRDAWIYLLHIVEVYIGFRFIRDRQQTSKVKWAILGLALLIPLFSLRWYAAVSIVLGMFAWYAYQFRSMFALKSKATAMIVLLAVIGSGAVFCTRAAGVIRGMETYECYYDYRSNFMDLEEGSNLHIDITKAPLHMVLPLYGYSFVSNAVGPLPWQVRGNNMLLSAVTEGPILCIVAFGIWRRRRYWDSAAWYVLLHALVWLALIAFANDNLGTALRLRVLGWNCLFVAYAYLLCKTPKLHKARAAYKSIACTRPRSTQLPAEEYVF